MLVGGFHQLPNSKKVSGGVWSAEVALKEPLRCLNATQQSVFLFLLNCKFIHPADLGRDAPSLLSSSATDRDLRLLATAF